MLFKDYKHCTPIQLRFSDIDKLNHVNNAYYLTYIESARLNYFKQVFNTQIDWAKTGFVVARNEINYLKPIYLNDDIYCFTKATKLGNKSMTLQTSIVRKEGETFVECASGISILVVMDYVNKVSTAVPELWRSLINTFEAAQM